MKILSLTDLSYIGGAAIAGNRISETLRSNGVEVVQLSSDGRISKEKRVLLNGKKFSSLDNILSPFFSKRIAKSLRDNNIKHQFRKFLQKESFDAINIHNLHCAVWTLHDCWSFLGSFHSSHCSPPSNALKKELNDFWKSLELTKPKHSLMAATPSDWINNQASSYYWNKYVVKTIRNPVPKSFFSVLKQNTSCFDPSEEEIHNRAVWTEETNLSFHSNGADGGRLLSQGNQSVGAVRLSDYLQTEVNMLKMDIEGAEKFVLPSIAENLKNVEHLFLELHVEEKEPELIEYTCQLLREQGFRYKIDTIGLVNFQSFHARDIYSMQMNIYAVNENFRSF